MFLQKILIAFSCFIRAFVLDKGVVTAQVHGHGSAAHRTVRYQGRWNFHVLLFQDHFPDCFLIVIGLVMTGKRTLPQAVVSLGVKQPLFIKAGHLELMVHVGGQNKIISVFQ